VPQQVIVPGGQKMSAREAGRIVIWALLTAVTIALLLSFIPKLTPDRKGFFNRLGYCFLNYGLPAWFVIELILFLATRRWIP
jgi:hypothetical protein